MRYRLARPVSSCTEVQRRALLVSHDGVSDACVALQHRLDGRQIQPGALGMSRLDARALDVISLIHRVFRRSRTVWLLRTLEPQLSCKPVIPAQDTRAGR